MRVNMFYLDTDSKKCAEAHYDVHVIKMILESAQLLSTVHRFLDGEETIKLDKINRKRKTYVLNNELDNVLYKSTHVNHPVAKWARISTGNYQYLFDLYVDLCKEYTFRFGKTHKSEGLKSVLANFPANLPTGDFTEPAITTDENNQFKTALESYRNYYATSKLPLLKYTERQPPSWLPEV